LKVLVISVVLGLSAIFCAAGDSPQSISRAFYGFGSSMTVGDSISSENLGYGFSFKWGMYIDPSKPSGFYYGFFSSFLYHSVGGVSVTDVKYATLGWRGLLAQWLGFDASLSPVLGARISGNTIEGNAYLGICPSLGFFIPVSGAMDIAISYEPVINLFIIDGSQNVRNKSYSDVTLLLVFKSHTRTEALPW
jgi:hypothetical protein